MFAAAKREVKSLLISHDSQLDEHHLFSRIR